MKLTGNGSRNRSVIPLTLDDWIRIDAGRRAKLDRQSNPTNNTGFQQADS